MLRLALLLAALGLATNALAADGKDKPRDDRTRKSADMVILSDPAQGRTVGRVGGDPILLQQTPTGTIGKIGKDKVLLHKDGHGNTLGKVGDRKLFCHSDPATGLTLCK